MLELCWNHVGINLESSWNYVELCWNYVGAMWEACWNDVGIMLESVSNEKSSQIQVEMKLD